MKKVFAVALSILLVICLGACSDGNEATGIEKEIQGCWSHSGLVSNIDFCFKNGQYRFALLRCVGDDEWEISADVWGGGVYEVSEDNRVYLLNFNGENDGFFELAMVDGKMRLVDDDGDVYSKVPSAYKNRVAIMDALFELGG